jgi:hypothetical protein
MENLLKRKDKLERILQARRDEIKFKMSRVPMLKFVDKIAFVCGVVISWMFAYLLGRYPRDYFLIFFTILIIPLVFFRWIRYMGMGMHYYLIDLCYFSTALILYNIWFDPRNEALLRIGFLSSHGCLAVSIMAFRNSMVFHDMDCITSMSIHAAPMLITHHIRWGLIPQEESWPEDQRKFSTISKDLTAESYFKLMLTNPLIFYFSWLICYAIVNFVISYEKIRSKNYNTLYLWFSQKPYWRAKIQLYEKWLGQWTGPIIFMFGHFIFFITTHCIAMVEFDNYYFNVTMMTFYVGCSLWNGANYYMEYFSKRYESKLASIEALGGKSLTMEERQKICWGD